ncbi:MAG TPA: hypothetical protein VN894_11345 [Polyangiaceae bacterium]|nr:hypothetical protein [Polyangiaceae bacterium]
MPPLEEPIGAAPPLEEPIGAAPPPEEPIGAASPPEELVEAAPPELLVAAGAGLPPGVAGEGEPASVATPPLGVFLSEPAPDCDEPHATSPAAIHNEKDRRMRAFRLDRDAIVAAKLKSGVVGVNRPFRCGVPSA